MTFDRRWLPAALAALLLIVAACGDDDAGSTPTDESTQAATAADTATSVPTETSTPDPTEGPGVLPASIANFAHVSLTVAVGDTVRWTNVDEVPHTATSSDGDWDSGTLSAVTGSSTPSPPLGPSRTSVRFTRA